MQTVATELDLTYRRRFSDLKIPEAYESLILDALKGDHSNFVRDDELDASWRIFTPLLHYLDGNSEITPMEYPYGKTPFRQMGIIINYLRLTICKVPAVLLSWMILRLLMGTNSVTRLVTSGEAPSQTRTRCNAEHGTGVAIPVVLHPHVLDISPRLPTSDTLL